MDISISDITSFLRCRRAWDLTSPNRQGLRKIGVPKAALHIGSGVHAALAAGRNWSEALEQFIDDTEARFVTEYFDAVGMMPYSAELDPLYEMAETIRQLVERYFRRYGDDPFGGKYDLVAVEQTFRVPIPGTDGFLIGTFDRILRERATGTFWVGEIKTYNRKPNYTDLVMRPQFSAYVWAAQALLGEPVAGILYDGLSQKLPKPPARLAQGGLSKTWSDSLDFHSYYQAIRDTGEAIPEYNDILARLAARDDEDVTPFYARYRIPTVPTQMWEMTRLLLAVYREIRYEMPSIYPNFTHTCSYDCQVRDLCHAMQLGEDVTFLKQASYTTGSGSPSFAGRHGVEREVDADVFMTGGV